MLLPYCVEKCKERKFDYHPIYYFESMKMCHVCCTVKGRQIFLNSLLPEIPIHALHLLQDEASASENVSTTVFHRHHNFLPKRTPV